MVGDAASARARLFLGAVYFFGAVPLAGVWVLAGGEVRASRWRAAATHVRVAVVHRPGAASWDDGGADVCPACRVRFDAIQIVRLFFLFCVVLVDWRLRKIQELRQREKE